jgi:ADP-ribosylglycohydrolase
MLGAIAGDIIGSVHEWTETKTTDFELFHPNAFFTDDTVLAVAVADCLMHGHDYVDTFHRYFHAYPGRGYGGRFLEWAEAGNRAPYNSWGNGSAMRVAAVGWAFDSLDEVRTEARRSAEPTHNHPEGVKGAEATAAAIFLARSGHNIDDIRERLENAFGYEDAVRKAISLGGDADTLACITGGIAEAFYGGVPEPIAKRALELLDDRLRGTVIKFRERYCR